ncbi:MAG: 1-acyl-sn-glycerol-3-phosphate acyltransferase [Saprospirales bacterium]|nr:1-acyl-sn-glycerol-3-phosphate acyltransferase [Saprospirales bacterium]
MITYFRGIFRFFIFLFTSLYYLIPILIRAAIRGDDLAHTLKKRRIWANHCTRLVGVRIEVNTPPDVEGPCVYVSNHRSYFDPVAALRDVEALPVAKAEVSSWPFIGFAAKATGVMWVKRENRDSRRRTVEAIEETLKEGFSVLIYPEGSTHIELKSHPFRQGAFRVAAELGVPSCPLPLNTAVRKMPGWGQIPSFLIFIHLWPQAYLCQNAVWAADHWNRFRGVGAADAGLDRCGGGGNEERVVRGRLDLKTTGDLP